MVAVVGGGQLARMMAPAATALGVGLRVLVESPSGSAAQVLADARHGLPREVEAVLDLVSGGDDGPRAQVLTFEHEHIPAEAMAAVAAAGTPVRPGPDALLHAQDKIAMRRRLTELGVPSPRWTELADAAALDDFLTATGGQAVVKTARGGYDGKGVRVVTSSAQVAEWFAASGMGGPALLAEEKVPFVRELAVLLARRPSGELRVWPVVQTVQVDGVCAEVLAPAPDLSPELEAAAVEAAVRVAEGLDVTGVLAVEMFEVAPEDGAPTGRVVVNELAMRPHNSGHWTIDGAVTSQFEQHLRAVLDLPLGDPAPTHRWSVMANVLGSSLEDLADALPTVLADPGVHVHLYGKEVRPGRKLGHVTVCGDDLDDIRRRALTAAAHLRGDSTHD